MNFKKIAASFIMAATVLLLAACNWGPVSGTVVDKYSRPVCIKICTPHWYIKVKTQDGQELRVETPKHKWDSINVGDQYSDSE